MTAVLPRLKRPAVPSDDAVAGADLLRFFQVLTFGYPVLWAVGIGGLYWVLIGLAGALYLGRRRRIARAALPLAVLVLALVASLPVGVLAFGLDLSRVASFFGNVLVWIGVIALIGLARDRPRDVVESGARGIIVIGIAQAALTLVGQVLYPVVPPVPLLGGLAERLPSGLGAFARTGGLYVPDWLNGVAFRSTGLMAQPTWAGAIAALAVILGLRAALTGAGRWRVAGVLAVVGGLYSLDLSLSRSTEISLAVAAVVGVVVALRRYSSVLFGVLATIGAVVVAAVLLTGGRQLGTLVEGINDARSGSLDSRSAIYQQTFGFVQQLPLPVIGYGIKPKEEGLVASVATHSSYLGLLFRSGAIGLVALLVFFAIVLVLAVRTSNGWGAALATLITIWCSLEDFDPGHLVPLGIVVAYGLAVVGGQHATRRSGSPRVVA